MLKKIREFFGGRSPAATEIETPRPPVHHGPKVIHRPIPGSDLDRDAVKIIERLTRFDHEAYLVGGCVRDLLLDGHPKDFDIATSATPKQIARLFRNSRVIGRRFRLAHIYFQNGKIIEVATFRSRNGADSADAAEGEDLLIRDDNEFGTPEEDALRRDFTINALFYDVNSQNVIDHADGLADLRRRLVRTIGDPVVRFREDPIRILRAIKFAARLDLEIEKETLTALRENSAEIPKAAAPRILEEIMRFGRERAARRSYELLRETGVFEVILPELARAYRDSEAWEFFLDLAAAMDARRRLELEVSGGEIFAALLLPLVAPRMGWHTDGSVDQAARIDMRDVIDDWLRPISLRLRIPRREQERCRQILGTLYRMAPWVRVRQSTRKALLRRMSLPQANWMLDVAGKRFGGELGATHQEWAQLLVDAPPAVPSAREEESGERGRGGRRGRRGGRGRGRGRGRGGERDSSSSESGRASKGESARAPKGESGRAPSRRRRPEGDRPPAARSTESGRQSGSRNTETQPKEWNDDYFFDALPSVPDLEGDVQGDRYGAREVDGSRETDDAERQTGEAGGGEVSAEDDGDGGDGGDSGDGGRPRRRRRRRRRRGSGKSEGGGQ